MRRQCDLLGVNRSGLYYQPVGESEENLRLMRLIDEEYTRHPFYGSRRMTVWLCDQGHEVNRKRVSRLMEVMGIAALYPKPRLSQPGEGHKIYPYLLKGVEVTRINQVWSTDITYVRMAGGFVYLLAVMDWFSRYVLSWALSVTMELDFCVEALKRALRRGRPEIFNSDQGSQFTRLVRHWSIIQIGAQTPPHLDRWRISTREFRENLEWAVRVPGDGEITPAVAQLLAELASRGIAIHDAGSLTATW